MDANHAVDDPPKRRANACGPCRDQKRRCDRAQPCKQRASREKPHLCSFADTNEPPLSAWAIDAAAASNNFKEPDGSWEHSVQAELWQLRRTVGELQDRVWRSEVQLAAAGSGQSHGTGDDKSNERIEMALEEMVACNEQIYGLGKGE